ncbi:MAG: PAS domain-containing protein, partial [Mesorhizobium sp.]|nr:PAS domain-containing protein [Mesorhizobium sp.]
MVHPSVDGRDDRERQRRFIGVMLAAPFLAAGGAVTLVTSGMGAAVTMAAIFASFGLCWFIALLVAASGKIAVAGRVALVMGGLALCGLVAAAGGPASPVALLAVALVFEAWWIGASRRAAVWGAVAAGSALLLAPLAADVLPSAAAGAAAWHWLLPLAWAMTLFSRLGGLGSSAAKLDQSEPACGLEEMVDAVVLRIARHGEVLDASAKARTMLKLPPELLLGTGLFDRVHLADRVAYLSALADMREGASSRRVELRLRLPRDAGGHQGHQVADNHRPFALDLLRAPGQA